ncbi:MAG TPA: lysozyme inhibitor LprI family protein [Rhodopila sp.]|uniref:lysozyme inhibitor LprI family protein n=1 Tax=Rhodopila sp. TaxID=2480087 RepID=UPI002CDC0E28|nr:lysozyme inhibitor LprI family protein [Rhodopila sp.]HVY16397.1 lysozyme inhibitor LprI family protein [Rhodopila sp.]
MTTRRVFVAAATILACLAAVPGAHAADCKDPSSQADMTACAAQSLAKSDAALNATYRTIMGRLKDDADTRRLLTAAQKAWIGFRDAECDFTASGARGGTAQGMIVAICKDDLTSRRVKQLDKYLHCAEGDLDCPVPAQ